MLTLKVNRNRMSLVDSVGRVVSVYPRPKEDGEWSVDETGTLVVRVENGNVRPLRMPTEADIFPLSGMGREAISEAVQAASDAEIRDILVDVLVAIQGIPESKEVHSRLSAIRANRQS